MKIKFLAAKVISVILIVFFAASMLTACGAKTPAGGQDQTASESTKAQEQTSQAEQNAPAASKAEITVWTWEPKDNQQKIIDDFNKDFPDITVNFTNVKAEDMAKKLQTALASGSDLPDVAWLENSFRGKLLALDCWDNLEAAPYNLDKSNILDYMIPLSSNAKGEVVGIEVSPAVAGLAYKRPLAKQYFGTDDPKEMEKIFTSWDVLIEKGAEVAQKSGGKVFLFASLSDVLEILKGQSAEPYIIGDKLNLKKSVGPMLSAMTAMKQKGIIDKLDRWSPPWNASHADDTHIFYPCATWYPTWVIKPNDKDGKDRWGLMIPPGGSFPMGGTIVAIPKKAKNKEAAFEYIKWMYLSEKGAASNRDHLEYFNTTKSIYKDPAFYSKPDEYFAGQDVLKTFAQDIIPTMAPSRAPVKYDQEVTDAINLVVKVINSSADGNLNVDDLVKKMQDDILAKVPDLQKE